MTVGMSWLIESGQTLTRNVRDVLTPIHGGFNEGFDAIDLKRTKAPVEFDGTGEPVHTPDFLS